MVGILHTLFIGIPEIIQRWHQRACLLMKEIWLWGAWMGLNPSLIPYCRPCANYRRLSGMFPQAVSIQLHPQEMFAVLLDLTWEIHPHRMASIRHQLSGALEGLHCLISSLQIRELRPETTGRAFWLSVAPYVPCGRPWLFCEHHFPHTVYARHQRAIHVKSWPGLCGRSSAAIGHSSLNHLASGAKLSYSPPPPWAAASLFRVLCLPHWR